MSEELNTNVTENPNSVEKIHGHTDSVESGWFQDIIIFIGDHASTVSAVSLAMVALATIYAALAIQRNVLRDRWLERQGEIYADFWNKKNNNLVRYWLICDEGYEKIEPVLAKRNDKVADGRNLTCEEYKILEIIDSFLCELTRFREFDNNHMNHRRRALWREVFGHWIKKIEERDAFKAYVKEYWKDADILRPPKKTFLEEIFFMDSTSKRG